MEKRDQKRNGKCKCCNFSEVRKEKQRRNVYLCDRERWKYLRIIHNFLYLPVVVLLLEVCCSSLVFFGQTHWNPDKKNPKRTKKTLHLSVCVKKQRKDIRSRKNTQWKKHVFAVQISYRCYANEIYSNEYVEKKRERERDWRKKEAASKLTELPNKVETATNKKDKK